MKKQFILFLLVLPLMLSVQEKTVVLTFDDACISHYTFVAPLLKKYGFGATFYVCEFPFMFGDSTKSLSWQQIKELSVTGFEIGNHTWHHKNVDEMVPGELDIELSYVEHKCDSMGIPKLVSFAYPAYHEDPASVPILIKHGYLTARAGGEKPWSIASDDPMHIPSYTIKGNKSEDKKFFYDALQQAGPGKIIVLTFHGVPDMSHPWVSTPPMFFEEYLQFLHNQHYRVVPMNSFNNQLRSQ